MVFISNVPEVIQVSEPLPFPCSDSPRLGRAFDTPPLSHHAGTTLVRSAGWSSAACKIAPRPTKHIRCSGVESLRLVQHLQTTQNLPWHEDLYFFLSLKVVIGDYAASNKSTAPLDECTSAGQVVVKQFREAVLFQPLATSTKDENNSDPWQHLHHMVSRGAEAGTLGA